MRETRKLTTAFLALSTCAACGPAPAPSSPADSATAAPQAVPSATAPAVDAPSAPAPAAWPFAARPDTESTALLDRLHKDAGPLRSNWVPPGKGDRYGHAEGAIVAPYDRVRAKMTDYAHYKDLAGPKFKSVRVVDKTPTTTDVYFQLPIMHGLITIWYVTRFGAPRTVGGAEVIEGTFVKGNIRDMHIAFTLSADDKNTALVCDLLLVPNVPAPQSALDEELRDACGDAVNAVRKQLTP